MADLIGTTSSTNFTQPATFERKHHSPPYSTLYVYLWGQLPNVNFPQDSQVGVPKLGLLISHNFGCWYHFQIKSILIMWGQYLITFKKIFPNLYNMPQSDLIWPFLSRDLWLQTKFSIWLPPFFFYHNSWKLILNEQCEEILSICTSRPF